MSPEISPLLKFTDTVKLALNSIKVNKLRTVITSLIIAIGITALVGILSSIDAMKSYLSQSFSEMGANTFNIKNRAGQIRIGGNRAKRNVVYKTITFDEAVKFKNQFVFPSALTSISVNVSFASTVKYGTEKTNPNTLIIGIDENYLTVSGYKLAEGRNFSPGDMEMNSPVTIIGTDIVNKVFKGVNPVGKEISAGGVKLQVVGVLESKGKSAGVWRRQ